MRRGLRRPAVVVHAFFPMKEAIVSKSPAQEALIGMWKRARGFPPRPIGTAPTVLKLDELPEPSAHLQILAAAERAADGDGFFETFVYRLHDVIGVSIVEAGGDDRRDWTSFMTEWFTSWNLEPTDVIGTAIVYLALSHHRQLAGRAGRLPRAIAAECAPPGLDRDDTAWREDCWEPLPGMHLWEVPSGDAPHPLRRVLAVAGRAHEDLLDAWFWGAGKPGAPFTRYLLHAAKLRHQQTLLLAANQAMGDTIGKVDAACAELESALSDESLSLDRLIRADQALNALQTDQHGLIAYLADVQDMTTTVRSSTANLDSLVGDSGAGRSAGPRAVDQQVGRWTLEQLRTEEAYLTAAQSKATESSRLAATRVGAALQLRRGNLTLFQTAVLGAILMALAAAQSFGYKPPLPTVLYGPTVFLLATLALALPSAVLRFSRGTGEDRRWAMVDVFFTALLGFAVGWFVSVLIQQVSRHGAAATRWYVLCGIVVAGAGAGLALLRMRRLGRAKPG
jgi:hypothetical protein